MAKENKLIDYKGLKIPSILETRFGQEIEYPCFVWSQLAEEIYKASETNYKKKTNQTWGLDLNEPENRLQFDAEQSLKHGY